MTLLHQAAQKAVEALTELADAGADAWSEDRPCQKQARAAITALQAALQQQPEPVAQIDESKLPPRPAGHNGPDTDPDSPLVRYGRAKPESGVLLEPMDDGYWTPWHIANEMLRSALQHQEVPREPADAQIIEQMKSSGLLEGDGPSMTVAQWDRLFTLVRHFAASPSTTRQQEDGNV